jgi:seryl-tRNA(Sec) selenium transferase
MSNNNEMQVLVGRTELLIRAITDAILSSAEVAAERIELAANVARIQQRMSAFGAVLESVGAQKEALAKQVPNATGPTKALLLKQIAMLASQEVAILTKAGIAEPTAVAALAAVEVPTNPTHRRDGRRFLRVAPGTKRDLNGTTEMREGHDGE